MKERQQSKRHQQEKTMSKKKKIPRSLQVTIKKRQYDDNNVSDMKF